MTWTPSRGEPRRTAWQDERAAELESARVEAAGRGARRILEDADAPGHDATDPTSLLRAYEDLQRSGHTVLRGPDGSEVHVDYRHPS
jgi:hypothetical protein